MVSGGLQFKKLFLDEASDLRLGFGDGEFLRALDGEVQLAFALRRILARRDVCPAHRYTGLAVLTDER